MFNLSASERILKICHFHTDSKDKTLNFWKKLDLGSRNLEIWHFHENWNGITLLSRTNSADSPKILLVRKSLSAPILTKFPRKLCTLLNSHIQIVLPKSNFRPTMTAIGLPFWPKIAHFQLSSTSSANQEVIQNSQFWPKSKAIGLPLWQKYSPIFNFLQPPPQIKKCSKKAKFDQKVRL